EIWRATYTPCNQYTVSDTFALSSTLCPGFTPTHLGNTVAGTTSYQDVTAILQQDYYYAVRAIDTTGQVGPFSPAAIGHILLQLDVWERTPSPQNANAGDNVSYQISFSNTGDVTGFSVFLTTLDGSFSGRVKANSPGGSF